jgi:hypothetical protein
MYSTTCTETLPSRLHSTTSTYLANTKLEVPKHYYTGYTLLELQIWHVLNYNLNKKMKYQFEKMKANMRFRSMRMVC